MRIRFLITCLFLSTLSGCSFFYSGPEAKLAPISNERIRIVKNGSFEVPDLGSFGVKILTCGSSSTQKLGNRVRQLFVGFKELRIKEFRSLNEQTSIAYAEATLDGIPLELAVLSTTQNECIEDLTLWKEKKENSDDFHVAAFQFLESFASNGTS